MEHGYVFSMAVGSIGEWLKLVPFLVDSGGGGGGGLQFILAVKHLKMNIMTRVPRKINK